MSCLLWAEAPAFAQNRTVAEECISKNANIHNIRVFDGAEPGLFIAKFSVNEGVAVDHRLDSSDIERVVAMCHMNLTKFVATDVIFDCPLGALDDACFSRRGYVAEFSYSSDATSLFTSGNRSAILGWVNYRVMGSLSDHGEIVLTVSDVSRTSDFISVEIVGMTDVACILTSIAFDGSHVEGHVFDGNRVVKLRVNNQISENASFIGNLKVRNLDQGQRCKFMLKLSMHPQR